MKLFYYDDTTENLLEEEDAVDISKEEWEEELYHLEDDDTSYLGILIAKEKYKIKCEADNCYKIYKYNIEKEEYELTDIVDFELAKRYFSD